MSSSTLVDPVGQTSGAVASSALARLVVALPLPGGPVAAQIVAPTPPEPTFEGAVDGAAPASNDLTDGVDRTGFLP